MKVTFIRRITKTYQFSGLLAKCPELIEPCHFISWYLMNEDSPDGLDIGTDGLGDLGQLYGLEPHAY